ncbi:hypothetical protein K438DRAFT_1937250 [Mycena galopus ATCC 62051]|nr:hypothetical protein K438DRAFT_1937250 [Mycena galopus ATCC 62051]
MNTATPIQIIRASLIHTASVPSVNPYVIALRGGYGRHVAYETPNLKGIGSGRCAHAFSESSLPRGAEWNGRRGSSSAPSCQWSTPLAQVVRSRKTHSVLIPAPLLRVPTAPRKGCPLQRKREFRRLATYTSSPQRMSLHAHVVPFPFLLPTLEHDATRAHLIHFPTAPREVYPSLVYSRRDGQGRRCTRWEDSWRPIPAAPGVGARLHSAGDKLKRKQRSTVAAAGASREGCTNDVRDEAVLRDFVGMRRRRLERRLLPTRDIGNMDMRCASQDKEEPGAVAGELKSVVTRGGASDDDEKTSGVEAFSLATRYRRERRTDGEDETALGERGEEKLEATEG